MSEQTPAISAGAVPAATMAGITWRSSSCSAGLPVRLHGPGQHWLWRYGRGGGLFFLAHAMFEVPSNLVLVRFGARRWIARILAVVVALAARAQTSAPQLAPAPA